MKTRSQRLLLVGLAVALLPRGSAAFTTNLTLFTTATAWSYNDAGTNLGTAWPLPAFDDSAWRNKLAVFYTDPLRPPPLAKTVLNAAPVTYYFRSHFTLNSAPSAVTLSSTATLDDGAVVYLNGTESLRVGLPAGAITFLTPASRTVSNSFSETLSIPAASIAPGDNVLAVEVHQDGLTKNAAFALSLSALVTFTNSPQMAIRLNEVLANSQTQTNANGLVSDWVELYNPSAAPVDLSDMSLSTDPLDPRAFVFAPGLAIPALGYLVIEFNNDVPASPTNTGFTIKSGSDAVHLYERPANGGLLVDSIVFGPQAADYTIGRLPDGSGNWSLNLPTRGAANTAAVAGNPATLKVNEWLAHSSGDGDWFEIYNPDPLPVLLSGLFFSQDTVLKPTQFPIPALSFIGTGPNAYVQFQADKATLKGANHVNFRLGASGDVIAIVAANGISVIHSVTFGVQTNHLDISEGSFPDGALNIVVFTNSTSPEASNFLPIPNVIINEALTHTDPPLEDAIELYNPTDTPADLSGWYLSNSHDNLKKYRIPNGVTLPANGFAVFYESQFNGGPGSAVPFTLNAAHGDSVHLSQADGLGNMTGYRSSVNFGPAASGVSFGRYQTSVGVEFTAMSLRTFGVDNPASLAQFRLGTGLANSPPKIGPVVISEIMYHPPSAIGVIDNTQDEYIELYNITGSPVPLYDPANPTNTWQFVDGLTFAFPSNVTVAANGFLLVVPFDPILDPVALTAFRDKYGVPNNVPVHGPYAGKLSNLGESLELAKPDPVQLPPHPDAGFVPYIRVDHVSYSPLAPWPLNADAGGASLQRRYPLQYGNDVANWAGIAPSPGRILAPPSIIAQPISLTVTRDNNASFSVSADGEPPLTYQWLFNGGAMAGATNATLAIASAQAANSGNYSVLVANPVISITSSVATLTVRIPPFIIQTPLSLIVTQGDNASFSVSAGGDPTLTFQWLFNGNAIPGATNTSLTITNAQAANAGNYRVRVVNAFGSITSAGATFVVRIPPTISQAPVSLIVTQGDNATFNVSADGDNPLSYQWLFNGGAITGATSASFAITSAQATNAGNYQVRVANNSGAVTSAVATLSVRIPPSITQQPVSLIVTQGANATFSVSASGDPPLTFQWLFNGGVITGAINSSLTITSAQAANAGNYQVRVANASGSVTSAIATLSVRIPPSITQQPLSLIVTQGANATFSVSASGDPPLTFQWLFSGGVITSATNTSLTITSAQATNAGNYQVRVANNSGAVTSAVATLSVRIPSSITQQPVSLIVTQGANATFSISASGDAPLTFQWLFNGGAIAGATNTSLTITNAQAANAGNYQVRVANGSGSVTSTVATLTIRIPPSITQQPVSLIVTQGANATFSISASGDPPLTFQWLFNGGPITGATNTSLAITSAQSTNAGNYQVRVANASGSVTSTVATLTIRIPPSITQQPVSLIVTQGANATFSISASGDPPLTFQWLFNGGPITGATNTSLTITSAQSTNAGNYQARVANASGSVTSAIATLSVRIPPSITQQPVSLIVTQGANATFSVLASGDPPLTFQWLFNSGVIAGATNTSLTITNAQAANVGNYQVRVANGSGSITGTVATLSVRIPPSITQQPLSLIVTQGANATFSISASGDAPLTFQWLFNGGPITGATNTSLTITGAQSTNAGNYQVRVANGSGSVTSTVATLTIRILPSITQQPVSLIVTQGANATFSVLASGDPPLTFQWLFNGGAIAGATNTSLTITSAQATNAGNYQVRVANASGSVTSTVATLSVRIPPSIIQQPVSLIVTQGANATFSVSASGDPPLTFQWLFNGGVITGATNASLTITSAQSTNVGNYQVRVANASGSVTSTVATLSVRIPPSITQQPVSLIVTQGANATFSVSANGDAPLTFQWLFNGGAITGATNTSLTITSAQAANVGDYQVRVANGSGSITSTVATLTIRTLPSITQQPVSLIVTQGANATFSISASGDAPLTFQWLFNGGPITGATNTSLTITSAQSTDAGNYQVRVANASGSVTSTVATLSVRIPPSITQQPVSLIVTQGANATFSISASGDAPLTFQWLFNGGPITGATNTSLTITSAQSTDAGNYQVRVANASGSVTSTVATLSVRIPPSITQQPVSLIVTQGANATFSISASGDPPLTFQWLFNGGPITGATNTSLTITSAQSTNAGNYQVRVANASGSVTSTVATLTIRIPPSITQQPVSLIVTQGANATFSISASGDPPLTFQWLFNGGPITGATNTSLTITSAQSTNAGNYQVRVANASGSVTSTVATLSVRIPPSITQQPLSLIVTQGANATFSVSASGDPPLAFQWLFNSGVITGATNASLTITSAQSTNVGNYQVRVANASGSVTSTVATLSVRIPPSITQQPVSLIVTQGANATFSVSASGDPPLTFQWLFNGGVITGATNASLTITSAQSTNVGNYQVRVANASGSVTSTVATLSVRIPPSITQQPVSLIVTQGANATFSVSASGDPPLTFQWLFNGGAIAGATNTSLTITSAQSTNVGNYQVRVANASGSITSTVATLTIRTLPSITQQPVSLIVTQGANATFSISASGDPPLTFQWLFNGGAIAGATNTSLTITSAQSTNAGNYQVRVANGSGSITSTVATLTIRTLPSITQQPLSLIVTQGANATFSISASGDAPLTFQWLFNGGPITGATNTSLTITSAQSTDAGNYQVRVANASGSVTSTVATLSVRIPPSITQQPVSLIVTQGANATFSISASGDPPLTFQWLFNGGLITGATNTSLTITNAQATNAGNYQVRVANGSGSITSTVATLTIRTLPSITQQPLSLIVTQGANATFSISASGDAPLTFQWLFNGGPITGATNTSLTITSAQSTDAGNYQVRVANASGSVTSTVATLSVRIPPSITQQPVSLIVTQGANATFSISASGDPPLTFQWLFNGGPITGATNTSLTITSAQSTNAGNYQVRVANGSGSITSTVATLTIRTLPSITQQPLSLIVTQGANATFSFSASGDAPLTFQWLFNGGAITGATNTSLTITNAQAANVGNYQVRVANGSGSVTSTVATLTIRILPSITQQPVSLIVTQGANATFSVSASGDAPLTFQWLFNGGAITGATNTSLTITNAQAANVGNYQVRVANASGSVTSTVATLSVRILPSITQQPVSLIVTQGANATFSVSASGDPPLTFQWLFNGGLITGATNTSLTITNAQAANAGNYQVRVANGSGSVTSAIATLSVRILPSITQQPASLIVTQGANATFSVSASGDPPLTFQWLFNSGVINGATNASLTITSAQAANEGNYQVRVANNSGAITSALALLRLAVGPSILTPPVDLVVTQGNSAVFSVAVGGVPAPSLQWRFNGADLAGETGSALTINNAQAGNAGNYQVAAVNTAGAVTSVVATLTVLSLPSIIQQPVSLTLAAGATAIFAVTASGTPPLHFQWQFNGSTVAGATNASLALANVQGANAGNYQVVVANDVGSITSVVATLTLVVSGAPVITQQPTNIAVAQGAAATFRVAASGTAPVSFQWRFNGNKIGGATASSLTLNGVQPSQSGNYTVVVANSAGSVTSAVATLTVLGPPTIIQRPEDLDVGQGNSATFKVTVSGTAPLAFQWRLNGTPLPGATNATLTLTNVQPANAGDYAVLVSNSVGSVISRAARLRVFAPPTITGIGYGRTTCSITFTTETGFSYLLEYSSTFNSTSNWSNHSTVNGTGGRVTITDTNATGATRFYRVQVE